MTKFVFVVVCFIYACMAGIAKSNTAGTFTYSGAESGGSSDGLVPEYHESFKRYKELLDPSYQSGKNIGIESERPIFTVNKNNMKEYSLHLSSGLQAVLNKYPNYEIQVFNSYRASSYPEKIQQQIASDSKSVHHPDKLSKYIPFKFPKNGF